MSMHIDPEIEQKLRQGFKVMNKFMVFLWRLGIGPWFGLWPNGWGQIMVITHTGRKTGNKYKTPVNFAELEGEVYCIAGFGKTADWYRNLIINPEVEIWLPNGWWKGIAEDISDSPKRPEIMRVVITASGFAGRMFGLNPKKLDDEALALATSSYKVIHIHRKIPQTGPGGPNDLALVWQIAIFLLIPSLLSRRKKIKRS